ncbi:hypothetical protein OESDEN_07594 [Oesophagostomum dentatum]|uniref:DNA2/NAM7 helicase-like C-terminal domain-containing protein n=1 Tax=Oesophagostomum dentatum TaxID=61180 RepID=A0A0B1T9P0_OESDE|nr:hypothetical protein OESDEN_07594 [Oesophagostomum dentatum]
MSGRTQGKQRQAFGSGKAVVGAIVAARRAMLSGRSVLFTASTIATAAQFAETLLSIAECSIVCVLRYVSDTAVAEKRNPLKVEFNEVLKNLGDDFAAQLSEADRAKCAKFRSGRVRYDHYSSRETWTYTLADVIDMIFIVRPPDILSITTASLLNASSDSDVFAGNWKNFALVICDEESVVPEPVFVVIANHLPAVHHVYIGDIHQLEPHMRCRRTSQAAKFGSRSIIDIFVSVRAVPVAPLMTTFRAQPWLAQFGGLRGHIGGRTTADQRRLLLDLMTFPDGTTPFVLLDAAKSAVSRSHSNEAEALDCATTIDRLLQKGVAPEAVYIALARSRQGQFVLEHAEFLRKINI